MWEYKWILMGSDTEDNEATFRRLGANGWELASFFNTGGYMSLTYAIFKKHV